MLFSTFIIPIFYVVLGILFIKNGPKNINHFFGWRTPRAKKNIQNWRFANKLGGCVLIVFGILFLLTLITIAMNLSAANNDIKGVVLVLLAIEVITVPAMIVIVEMALKQFDQK